MSDRISIEIQRVGQQTIDVGKQAVFIGNINKRNHLIYNEREMMDHVVEFANKKGGHIFLGMHPDLKTVEGIIDPYKCAQRLVERIESFIDPHVSAKLSIVPHKDTHIIHLMVYPSRSGPHFFSKNYRSEKFADALYHQTKGITQ